LRVSSGNMNFANFNVMEFDIRKMFGGNRSRSSMKILAMVLGCTWCVHGAGKPSGMITEQDWLNSRGSSASDNGESGSESGNATPRRWCVGDEIRLYQPSNFPKERMVQGINYVTELSGTIAEDISEDGSTIFNVKFDAPLKTNSYKLVPGGWKEEADKTWTQYPEKAVVKEKEFSEADMNGWCPGLGDFLKFKVSPEGVWKCESEGYLSARMFCENLARGERGLLYGASSYDDRHIAVGSLVSATHISCDDYTDDIFDGTKMEALRNKKWRALGIAKCILEKEMEQDLSWMLEPRTRPQQGRKLSIEKDALTQCLERNHPDFVAKMSGLWVWVNRNLSKILRGKDFSINAIGKIVEKKIDFTKNS